MTTSATAWVGERLGIELRTTESPFEVDLTQVVGLALRHNPRRAHLLVSTLLGKHVPTDPRLVLGSGRLLGLLVAGTLEPSPPGDQARPPGAFTEAEVEDISARLAEALQGDAEAAAHLLAATARPVRRSDPEGEGAAVVLGYAETATALGHAVAEVLGARYLHSTRRSVAGLIPVGGFEEEHSHATSHSLLAEDPNLFTGSGPLVLVDDEISTGRTVLNTIEALHTRFPRPRYVVASLIDLRSDDDRQHLEQFAARIGVRIDVVALVTGRATLPAGLAEDSAALLAELAADGTAAPLTPRPPMPTVLGKVSAVPAGWPAGVLEGGRHGFGPEHEKDFAAAVSVSVKRLAAAVEGRRVLVLGFEELMYAPLRIAVGLADRLGPGCTVRYSTTTRSPVLAVDDPAYPIRTKLSFRAFDEALGEAFTGAPADVRHVYNATAGIDPGRRFDDVVLIIDEPADTDALHAPDGLPAQLAAHCDRVHLMVLPAYRPTPTREGVLPEPLHGPAFGSYPAAEVSWLLTDLSAVALEAPTQEREERVQSGGHYAESLPEEYQPGTEYQKLFEAALERSAARVAEAVGIVTERVLAARGADAVLVSLARAGTPIGVLMRRWAWFAHGLELPHYTTSIIRGRGIDTVALRYLAAQHDPATVMFVDGWTGKGAITRELAEALAVGAGPVPGFRPDLAVLADPGGCVSIFGTRDDFLIPSACLNSTVSGLVSRTVLNRQWIGDNDFHGGKFYRELKSADVSGRFLDVVTGHFPAVQDRVARDWPVLSAAEREPTWAGWAAVEQISREYGIDDVNLVKPGVGETTRVLLRRVPWKILVRTDAAAELGHVRWLAEQRGVEIVEVAQLPYSCVGLIHPRYTRGATGVDGRAARPLADTDLDPDLDPSPVRPSTGSGTSARSEVVR